MKTLTSLVIALLLGGCVAHWSLFPERKTVTPTASTGQGAARTLAAADARTEQVTLDGLNTIAASFADIRSLARDSKNVVALSRALDNGNAAVAAVRAEIAAHPAKAVGRTLVSQARQIEEDQAPDPWVLAGLYTLAGLCFAAAGVAQFARSWLVTVPVVGLFLSDLIGPRILKLLVVIGAGFFALARAYAWCARHPHWVDAFAVLIAVTLGIAYANTVDAGWFLKAEAWLRGKFSKTPAP